MGKITIAVAAVACIVASAAIAKPPERLNAADGREATRLVIHLSDLPAGWRVEKLSGGSSKCSTPDLPKTVVTSGKAESAYSHSQIDLAASIADVVTTAGASKTVFAYFKKFFPACMLKFVRDGSTDASIGAMSFPHVGYQSAAWSITAKYKGIGAYFDVIVVRVRRAFALDFSAVSGPVMQR